MDSPAFSGDPAGEDSGEGSGAGRGWQETEGLWGGAMMADVVDVLVHDRLALEEEAPGWETDGRWGIAQMK